MASNSSHLPQRPYQQRKSTNHNFSQDAPWRSSNRGNKAFSPNNTNNRGSHRGSFNNRAGFSSHTNNSNLRGAFSQRGGHYNQRGNHHKQFNTNNSTNSSTLLNGDFGGAEPSTDPAHWYQAYPEIPKQTWNARYSRMNACTLNLRTDYVPLVLPELRVADEEWGDHRLDAPNTNLPIPVVGWLPVCQKNPGAPWASSNSIPVVHGPPKRSELVDDELTWPAAIDPVILATHCFSAVVPTAFPKHEPEAVHPNSANQASFFGLLNTSKITMGQLTAAATAPSRVPQGLVQSFSVTRENSRKRMINVNWDDDHLKRQRSS